MSLVAYDNSGSESESEDANESQTPVQLPQQEKMEETSEMTNGTPQTTNNRKRKQPIRILAPSLEDVPEVDIDKSLRRQKKLKLDPDRKTGLLKLIPPPRKFLKIKKTTDLVPHVVSKKPVAAAKPRADSDDEEDSLHPNQFFTLDVPKPSAILPGTLLPSVSVPAVEPMEVEHTVAPPPEHSEKEVLNQYLNNPENMPDTCLPDNMDMEVLRKLQGRTNLGREDIEIIDVHADDQRTDPNVWITKQMTMEMKDNKKTPGDKEPSAMHRRKHQITYLAHQAKEREIELKNQWALNRLTRQQSQSKYGF